VPQQIRDGRYAIASLGLLAFERSLSWDGRSIHRVDELLDSIDENFDSVMLSLAQLQVENSVKPP
jgi:hypothetical protein